MTNADMTCARARRALWPDGGPKPASPSVVAAQKHVATCAACQAFMAEMRGLGAAVREAAPREPAPGDVRDRLFAALAQARAGRQPRRPRYAGNWPLLAAALLLVILGAALLADRLTRDPPADAIAALVEDHVRAIGQASVASTDPGEIEEWLGRHVHFGMQVPVLPGASLRGARITVFNGRRSAVLEYDVGSTVMSYFVIPNELASPGVSGSRHFDQTARAGYHLVSWREPGLLHAMVGNLSPSELLTLAKACVEQAQRAVG